MIIVRGEKGRKMRPIDADRLKTYYDRTCTSGGKFGEAQLKIIEWAKDMVDSCNTIDAIQVIRCKDCRWKHGTHCEWRTNFISSDDFCSDAERRTDA